MVFLFVPHSKTTACLAWRERRPFPCECTHERKRCTEPVGFDKRNRVPPLFEPVRFDKRTRGPQKKHLKGVFSQRLGYYTSPSFFWTFFLWLISYTQYAVDTSHMKNIQLNIILISCINRGFNALLKYAIASIINITKDDSDILFILNNL